MRENDRVKHQGVCTVSRFSEDRQSGFGFIELAGGEQIWVGSRSLSGPLQKGDEVSVILDHRNFAPPKCRIAFRVTVTKAAIEDDHEAITILPGEFEVDPL